MRKIRLRTVPVDHLGRELGPLSYAELICNIVLAPPGGLTLAEMPVPLTIKRLIETGGGELVLDEEQWSLLVRRVAGYRFPFAAAAYQEFGWAIIMAEHLDEDSAPAAVGPRAVA